MPLPPARASDEHSIMVPLPVSLSLSSSQPHSLPINDLSPAIHCVDRTTADSPASSNYLEKLLLSSISW